ncbi:MAG: NTP transferase domain-containing protein [Clostridia bacterium]|nr:NTP transferase domain-containing protein [Clostridia bacterium]
MKKDKIAIVMAAGKSTAMNSKKSKLVHKLYGKELVSRVVETAEKIDCDEIITVVGEQKEQVMEVLKNRTKYVIQEELLGTGHAILQVVPELESKSGQVIVLYGDVPIIRKETIEKLVDRNRNEREAVTLLTAISDNPTGYGRIVRNEVGKIQEIVEEKDADIDVKEIKEINSGIYCFDIEALLETIKELKPHDNGEVYLTDVIKIMKDKELKVGAMIVEDNTEILGVNDRVQLELLGRVLRMRINTMHMLNGVTIEDSDTTYIYEDVKIGKDTVIHPNTTIKSDCVIGEDCEIGPNAYIREKCNLADKVKIGNCVEIKKTTVAYGSKVPHLSYMGDCEIGTGVNIGCGSITCNYDGVNKHKTIIGDDCFIGSNTNLVAPVTLGDNVLVAAGSTITEDVPTDSLAIARERQTVKKDWNKK